jgi:hypothetical protein
MRWSKDEGIHLSPQILTCSPLPILHISPCSSTGLALSMLRHVKEGLAPSLACKKESLRKYFPFRTFASREFGCWISLQPCLARRAKLKTSKSRNPSPPLCLGSPNRVQLIQCTPLVAELWPHQNRFIRVSICEHRDLGSWKTLIQYAGMA